MAIPLKKIALPANAWVYFSNFSSFTKLIPVVVNNTIVVIVAMVTRLKTAVTLTTPSTLCCRAGNMSKGISGSQGPKTKMTKSIQGVRFLYFTFSLFSVSSSVWRWVCSTEWVCSWTCFLPLRWKCAWVWGLLFKARLNPQTAYANPKPIKSHPAMFPLNDSKASSFESATPAAIPINPISTELFTCSIPQRIVI